MNSNVFNLSNNIVQLEDNKSSGVDDPQFLPTANEIDQSAAPAKIWQARQDALADEAGLSILLVDGHQPPSLAVSNNNSVCRFLQSSYKHAHLCESYCGKAFSKVQKENNSISYRCHAGLQCVAAPLASNVIRPLVAIVGRALAKVVDYEELLERKQAEDWQDSPADDVFGNLRFAESIAEIENLAHRLQHLDKNETKDLLEFIARTEPNPFADVQIEQSIEKNENQESAGWLNSQKSANIIFHSFGREEKDKNQQNFVDSKLETQTVDSTAQPPRADSIAPQNTEPVDAIVNETFEDFTAWQLFIDVLLDKNFKDACAETLRFLTARYGLTSLAWLERSQILFKPFLVAGDLRDALADFTLKADDPRLQEAVLNETSLTLKIPQQIEVFPLAVGDDVRAAIVVGEHIADNERRLRLARFGRQIAVSLEVLRLREELSRRAKIIRAVQIFSEKLSIVEESAADDASVNLFDSLLQTCAELLDARRGSLLLFDERQQKLTVQAALGAHAHDIKQMREPIGERIAEQVWREGKPIVVENINNITLAPAPADRGYLSNSFISFPLFVGNRAIGILNLTDKRANGNSHLSGYNSNDLELLETIAPQLAIALDRATLHQKAGEFEQLSLTDALTGLLNRRYLDERLKEEVHRAQRDNAPLSLLMVDIDNFKLYNDRFGHQAGDEVLKMTAQTLKAALRSADVAARFGGEEFCLLLPNTTLEVARQIGERIRQRIEKTDFPGQVVTVSVGVSDCSASNNSPQEIIEAADKALYLAKRTGKNNVQLLLFEETHG